jgi:hypothetical protein
MYMTVKAYEDRTLVDLVILFRQGPINNIVIEAISAKIDALLEHSETDILLKTINALKEIIRNPELNQVHSQAIDLLLIQRKRPEAMDVVIDLLWYKALSPLIVERVLRIRDIQGRKCLIELSEAVYRGIHKICYPVKQKKLPEVENKLEKNSPEQFWTDCLKILGRTRNIELIPLFRELYLDHIDPKYKGYVLRAIGSLNRREALRELIEIFRAVYIPSDQLELFILALGDTGLVLALPFLKKLRGTETYAGSFRNTQIIRVWREVSHKLSQGQ